MRTILLKAGIVAAILLGPTALLGAPRDAGRHDSGTAALHSQATITPTRSIVGGAVRGATRGGVGVTRGAIGGTRSLVSPGVVGPRAVEPRAYSPRYDYGNRAYDRGRYGWDGDGRYRWSGDRWWYWGPRGWLWWNGGRWIDYAVRAAVGASYRWYGGYWWYWMPRGYWVYWDGNQWVETGAAAYDNGAYDNSGYSDYNAYPDGYRDGFPNRGYYRGPYDYDRDRDNGQAPGVEIRGGVNGSRGGIEIGR